VNTAFGNIDTSGPVVQDSLELEGRVSSGFRISIRARGCSLKIAFVHTYRASTSSEGGASSDSIGYGITSADLLVQSVRNAGHEVVEIRPCASRIIEWRGVVLSSIARALRDSSVDAIFLFHCANPLAASVRQLLNDSRVNVPLVGYTHGSHWDPTDVYRGSAAPFMQWADLGNLLAMDLIFFVSGGIRDAVLTAVADAAPGALADVASRAVVTHLPVSTPPQELSGRDSGSRKLVYNHSFDAGKAPQLFFRTAASLLSYDAELIVEFTRSPTPGSSESSELDSLVRGYPRRVEVHGGLSVRDYYEVLAGASHQMSTASHESFGVATFEAILAGCCAILPDRAAYREFFGSVPFGLYQSGQEISRAMELLNSEEQSHRLWRLQDQVARRVTHAPSVTDVILRALMNHIKADSFNTKEVSQR